MEALAEEGFALLSKRQGDLIIILIIIHIHIHIRGKATSGDPGEVFPLSSFCSDAVEAGNWEL